MVRSSSPLAVHGRLRKKWVKSPIGWGLANMWYDKFVGIPPRGSLLEMVFVLVHIERHQTSLLQTRATVQSIIGLHEKRETQDPAIKAFAAYAEKMFPFLEKAGKVEEDEQYKRLRDFTKHAARIDLRPVYQAKADAAKQAAQASNRRNFRLRPKLPGTV